MELNGFYDEEELAEMLDRKEITRKEYITHHSAELLKQYEEFCSDFGLEQTLVVNTGNTVTSLVSLREFLTSLNCSFPIGKIKLL